MNASTETLIARASVLYNAGRFREAHDALLQVDAAGAGGASLGLQLGQAQLRCGNAAEAEFSLRRALARAPADRDAHYGLALALMALGRHSEAEEVLKRLLEIHTGDFESLWKLGVCRLVQGDPCGAEANLRLALAIDAEQAAAWTDLGAALDAQDRRDEAIAAAETAVRIESTRGAFGSGFVNLAIDLADANRLEEAITLHEQMLPRYPYIYGHVAYAQALLKSGRLREGWQQYEFRFLCEPLLSRRQKFGRPIWSGQDLRGKTVLLLAEQGLGDTIQFIRFAPRLKALGASVLLRVPDGFEAFAEGFPGVDSVLERGTTRVEFDYFLNVISLANAFGIDSASIPANIPYVQADPEREARWASRLAARANLGLALSGLEIQTMRPIDFGRCRSRRWHRWEQLPGSGSTRCKKAHGKKRR